MAVSEVVMPSMGADMREGTILRWRKNEGDQVERGEIIAEIETDKANVEIEAFGSGVFRKQIGREGDTVPVGTVIAVIAAPDDDISKYGAAAPSAAASEPPKTEATSSSAGSETQAQAPSERVTATSIAPQPPEGGPAPSAVTAPPPPPSQDPAPSSQPASTDGRLRASPVARRLAEEHGIDLHGVQGTGPDGRIVKRDVEAARNAPKAQPSTLAPTFTPMAPIGEDRVEDLPMSRIRQTIARRMQQAKQQVPHYYLQIDVDMTEALAMRQQLNKSLGKAGKISVNDVIIYATAKALQKHPKFNALWVEDHVQTHSQVNIGIAVALDDGLVVAAILDVAHKGLQQISHETRDVATRAKSGALRAEEYTNATFNISNLGGFGVDVLTAIITPPQVAVLGIGAAREQAVVRDGEIVPRSIMSVVLSADHRASDGADGARFLATLRSYLETPTSMML